MYVTKRNKIENSWYITSSGNIRGNIVQHEHVRGANKRISSTMKHGLYTHFFSQLCTHNLILKNDVR